MDRGLPQSTSNGPTSGMFHTLPQKKTSNTNHERNQDYSRNKSSDNEVSVVKFIRASPNTVAPSAPIKLSTKTHPSGEIQIQIQQNSSNGRRCQQAIATIATIATIALDT
jgi:hypothetical protein